MSVWLTIPSKRPSEQAEPVLHLWRERGYKIALWRDPQDLISECPDVQMTGPYAGYAYSVNALIKTAGADPEAEWFVAAGDDVEPDLNRSAQEIARECTAHFHNHWECLYPPERDRLVGWLPSASGLETFGVMQPTGDRWGDRHGPYIDRVAGSAWIGREFARRMYGGHGPLWPEYFHMFTDQELQEVATRHDVFWQRPDLIQLHRHWGRPREGERAGQRNRMPRFLEKANSPVEWAKAKELFAARKAAGFPGSEPL